MSLLSLPRPLHVACVDDGLNRGEFSQYLTIGTEILGICEADIELWDVEANISTACNWAHGVAQLFWLAGEEPSSATALPCSCAKVELIRQFL